MARDISEPVRDTDPDVQHWNRGGWTVKQHTHDRRDKTGLKQVELVEGLAIRFIMRSKRTKREEH